MGARLGLCAAPEMCIRGGRLDESGVTLERMGPAWELETAVAKWNRPLKSPPASATTAAEGEQPCFTWAPARSFQAGSREALCVPCASAGLAAAPAWESAASLQRPRPGLSPSRALAAAGGRETEARSAEHRDPSGLGVGEGGPAGRQGHRATMAGMCGTPVPGRDAQRCPGVPAGGSARSPHRRGCSGVPAPAQPSGRGQEAAVTV